jgi:hypothetical protein
LAELPNGLPQSGCVSLEVDARTVVAQQIHADEESKVLKVTLSVVLELSSSIFPGY